MGFFKKLFAPAAEQAAATGAPEHAVIVHFRWNGPDLEPVFELESELEQAIEAANAGEFDGNEFGTDGSASFYMYGPDGDALFAAVKPALESCEFMKGAKARVRYGPPQDGVREVEHVIAA